MKNTQERLEVLENQHRELDKKIQIAYKNYLADHLLKELKQRKFKLKSQITRLRELDNNA